MNHIYRVVFNHTLGVMQAIAETGKSATAAGNAGDGNVCASAATHVTPHVDGPFRKQRFAQWVALATAVFVQGYAHAASTNVIISSDSTTSQNLAANGSVIVDSGVTLNVSDGSNAIAAKGTGTITNNGTIEETGSGGTAGRAIRDKSDPLTLTIINNGLIYAKDDDAIQIQYSDNSVSLSNYGQIISDNVSEGGAQAIDFNAITTGANSLYNAAGALIEAYEADAVRPGVNGTIDNAGTIYSYNNSATIGDGSDGIDAQTNSGVAITNESTGVIEGARHGITGGNNDTTTDGTFTMSVTNELGGVIKGDDGSGINIDGFNGNEVVTIVNHGTISGNGVTGDGDGVDVDGLVNLVNTGTIVSLHSNDDVSEGVTVGGGTIINSGTIEGENSATNSDGSLNTGTGRGITLAGIDKDPDTGDAIPVQGIYGDTSVVNSGLIKGDSDAGIAVTGAATNYKLTITNLAGGTIEGGGTTAAAIETVAQDVTVINYGTITADASGKAVNFGSSDSTLEILGGTAVVNGDINGGTGTSTLIIEPGAGNSFSYDGAISNFATVTIGAGTTALYGVSTYTADTTLDGGTLVLGNSSAIGSGTLNTLNATVGYLDGVRIANAIAMQSDTTLNVDGAANATQAGSIGESGGSYGVTKTGTGTLVLDGVNSYTGETLVSAGTLQLGSTASANASLAGSVSVSSGATLAGYGTIAGDLENMGTVEPGSASGASGTLTVAGNYTQSANATLLVNVDDGAVATGSTATDSGYGRLVVNGSATIDAGSSVSLSKTGSYAFAPGQRYVVVDASASGTNYNAATLDYSASGYSGDLFGQQVTNGSRSDLVVSLAGGSTSTLATTPNAIASLTGLGNYTGISTQLLNLYDAAQALSLGSSGAATRAGAQLGPAAQVAAGRAAASPTLDAMNVIAAHTDSLRVAQSGSSGISTGDAAPSWGVWGQAFGGHASQGVDDGVDGFSANYGGLLFGADRAIGDRWRAGGAFTYTNTAVNNTDNSAGDSTRINGYGLIGYASYSGNPWYVNLSAAATLQRYNSTRVVSFEGYSGNANSQYNGEQYAARAEFGYPLALGGATLTPLASLAYSYLHQNAYTETGGNGSALAVDATHTTSVRSGLGARIEKGFSTHYGEVVPYLQAQWVHEYDHDRALTGASFAADSLGETAFTTVGASPVSDLADLTLGVTLANARNLSVTARYELQAGAHFVSNTGALRLRQLF